MSPALLEAASSLTNQYLQRELGEERLRGLNMFDVNAAATPQLKPQSSLNAALVHKNDYLGSTLIGLLGALILAGMASPGS
jgi:hypothetical protein